MWLLSAGPRSAVPPALSRKRERGVLLEPLKIVVSEVPACLFLFAEQFYFLLGNSAECVDVFSGGC